MRQIVLATLVLFFLSTFSYGKKYKGLIIYPDTTVSFTYSEFLGFGKPSTTRLQNRIKYKDENGEKHILLPTDEVLEVQFFHKDDTLRMLKVKRAGNVGVYLLKNDKDYLFLELIVDGPVQLLHYYYNVPGSSHSMFSDIPVYSQSLVSAIPVYKRANEDIFTPSGLPSFRKAMSDYFKDCPELSKSIASGEYKERENKKIIEYYNEHCQ